MKSTQRSAELIASFKQVAVDQTSDRRRTYDLNTTVQDVLRSMRPSLKGRAWVLDCDIPEGIQCDGYPGPLGQVVSNLVQNAVLHGFAAKEHGRVLVSGKRLEEAQVQLSVEDDGHGIPAKSLGKIFDPFFTTRLGNGGSGLGLTIVHNLVTVVLGGRIEVSSIEGQGTRFTLTIPLSAPQPKASALTPVT
jgi:signal transduction histidine kinase